MPSSLWAQFHSRQFQNIDLSEGLSQSTVYESYQDYEGFMWFGTRDGLNRYDGYNFTVYRENPADSAALKQTTIRAISGDSNGYLWIGTDGGGLYRYSIREDQFEHIVAEDARNMKFATSNILSLVFDKHGDLWIGTRNQGILKYQSSDGHIIQINNEYGQVWSLVADPFSESVWVGTDQGLLRINNDNQAERYLPNVRIESLEISEREIWIGTFENGLYRLDMQEESVNKIQRVPDDISILSLLKYDNELWIGTATNGLFIMDSESPQIRRLSSDKTPEANLNDNSIRSLYKDRTETIWIGSNNTGIYNWSKFRFKFDLYKYSKNKTNTLNNDVVLSFTEDEQGRLWVGTDGGGINVFDRGGNGFTYFTGNERRGYDVNNAHIIAMITDQYGNIWIGTDGGGLNKWNAESGRFEYIMHERSDSESLSDNSVLTLLEDSRGYLWVGTYQGLNRFDPYKKTFRRFGLQTENSTIPTGNRILALLEDSDGYIWIGTYGGGLNRLDPRTGEVLHFEHNINDPESISSNRIQCLYEDEYGGIWIGTYNGLNRYNPREMTFEVFNESDGLLNDVIYGIMSDNSENFWLSTNGGITRFDPVNEETFNFTVNDGLQSNEFNGGAYYKNRKGELYFGGINGFNIIDPQNITFNKSVPPVQITSFRVAGEETLSSAKNNKPVRLSHDENFFSFQFSALDFVASESNRYRYKLKGFDDNWIASDTRNSARYTNVPFGEYVFRLQAANSDGIWNRSGVSLPLNISPPYWQTWWFKLSFVVIVILVSYSLYRYRINALLKVQHTRQRIARDLHDEVSSTLSSITYFAQAIRQVQNGEQANRFVGLISESAFEAKEKITDIIWAIDPSQDDWVSLLSKSRRFASDLFESKGMDYELDIDTDIDTPLKVELRQHLWLIFKEMVVNAARHSEGCRVDVFFRMQGNHLKLVVQDNGAGLPADFNQRAGNGINNIRQRASQIGAEISLESDRDIGTRWFMSLKLT